MTFKIGDKIRITKSGDNGSRHQAEIGSIDEIVSVDLNGERVEGVEWFYEVDEIELVTESPSGWSTDGNPLLTILEETTAKARQLIIEKGGEYAADTDVLANFRHEGEEMGLPMEVIWHIYIGKHLSAISRYVRDIKDGKTDRPRMETLESRADDIITYMIHFKMMLKERQNV